MAGEEEGYEIHLLASGPVTACNKSCKMRQNLCTYVTIFYSVAAKVGELAFIQEWTGSSVQMHTGGIYSSNIGMMSAYWSKVQIILGVCRIFQGKWLHWEWLDVCRYHSKRNHYYCTFLCSMLACADFARIIFRIIGR